VESTVTICVHVKLVGSFLEQVGDAQALAILGTHGERSAAITVHRVDVDTFVQKILHRQDVAMDTGPVDGQRPVVVVALLVQRSSLLHQEVHQVMESAQSSPVDQTVAFYVQLACKVAAMLVKDFRNSL